MSLYKRKPKAISIDQSEPQPQPQPQPQQPQQHQPSQSPRPQTPPLPSIPSSSTIPEYLQSTFHSNPFLQQYYRYKTDPPTQRNQLLSQISEKCFQIPTPHPIQLSCLHSLLSGRDVFLRLPTSGGKSLIYQLYGQLVQKTVIVVTPLISLADDQVQILNKWGLPAISLSTLTDTKAIHEILVNGCAYIFVTPERLVSSRAGTDVLSQSQNLTQTPITTLWGAIQVLVKRNRVALFVVDEAHCIVQWGSDFRPEFSQLGKLKQSFPTIPLIAMTATSTIESTQTIIRSLDIEHTAHIFIEQTNRSNIAYMTQKRPFGDDVGTMSVYFREIFSKRYRLEVCLGHLFDGSYMCPLMLYQYRFIVAFGQWLKEVCLYVETFGVSFIFDVDRFIQCGDCDKDSDVEDDEEEEGKGEREDENKGSVSGSRAMADGPIDLCADSLSLSHGESIHSDEYNDCDSFNNLNKNDATQISTKNNSIHDHPTPFKSPLKSSTQGSLPPQTSSISSISSPHKSTRKISQKTTSPTIPHSSLLRTFWQNPDPDLVKAFRTSLLQGYTEREEFEEDALYFSYRYLVKTAPVYTPPSINCPCCIRHGSHIVYAAFTSHTEKLQEILAREFDSCRLLTRRYATRTKDRYSLTASLAKGIQDHDQFMFQVYARLPFAALPSDYDRIKRRLAEIDSKTKKPVSKQQLLEKTTTISSAQSIVGEAGNRLAKGASVGVGGETKRGGVKMPPPPPPRPPVPPPPLALRKNTPSSIVSASSASGLTGTGCGVGNHQVQDPLGQVDGQTVQEDRVEDQMEDQMEDSERNQEQVLLQNDLSLPSFCSTSTSNSDLSQHNTPTIGISHVESMYEVTTGASGTSGVITSVGGKNNAPSDSNHSLKPSSSSGFGFQHSQKRQRPNHHITTHNIEDDNGVEGIHGLVGGDLDEETDCDLGPAALSSQPLQNRHRNYSNLFEKPTRARVQNLGTSCKEEHDVDLYALRCELEGLEDDRIPGLEASLSQELGQEWKHALVSRQLSKELRDSNQNQHHRPNDGLNVQTSLSSHVISLEETDKNDRTTTVSCSMDAPPDQNDENDENGQNDQIGHNDQNNQNGSNSPCSAESSQHKSDDEYDFYTYDFYNQDLKKPKKQSRPQELNQNDQNDQNDRNEQNDQDQSYDFLDDLGPLAPPPPPPPQSAPRGALLKKSINTLEDQQRHLQARRQMLQSSAPVLSRPNPLPPKPPVPAKLLPPRSNTLSLPHPPPPPNMGSTKAPPAILATQVTTATQAPTPTAPTSPTPAHLPPPTVSKQTSKLVQLPPVQPISVPKSSSWLFARNSRRLDIEIDLDLSDSDKHIASNQVKNSQVGSCHNLRNGIGSMCDGIEEEKEAAQSKEGHSSPDSHISTGPESLLKPAPTTVISMDSTPITVNLAGEFPQKPMSQIHLSSLASSLCENNATDLISRPTIPLPQSSTWLKTSSGLPPINLSSTLSHQQLHTQDCAPSTKPTPKSFKQILSRLDVSPNPKFKAVRTIHSPDELSEALKYSPSVAFYHGALSTKQRNDIHRDFTDQRFDILVATIAFGLGINAPFVQSVLHWGVPRDLSNYHQESGRAGRGGAITTQVIVEAGVNIHDDSDGEGESGEEDQHNSSNNNNINNSSSNNNNTDNTVKIIRHPNALSVVFYHSRDFSNIRGLLMGKQNQSLLQRELEELNVMDRLFGSPICKRRVFHAHFGSTDGILQHGHQWTSFKLEDSRIKNSVGNGAKLTNFKNLVLEPEPEPNHPHSHTHSNVTDLTGPSGNQLTLVDPSFYSRPLPKPISSSQLVTLRSQSSHSISTTPLSLIQYCYGSDLSILPTDPEAVLCGSCDQCLFKRDDVIKSYLMHLRSVSMGQLDDKNQFLLDQLNRTSSTTPSTSAHPSSSLPTPSSIATTLTLESYIDSKIRDYVRSQGLFFQSYPQNCLGKQTDPDHLPLLDLTKPLYVLLKLATILRCGVSGVIKVIRGVDRGTKAAIADREKYCGWFDFAGSLVVSMSSKHLKSEHFWKSLHGFARNEGFLTEEIVKLWGDGGGGGGFKRWGQTFQQPVPTPKGLTFISQIERYFNSLYYYLPQTPSPGPHENSLILKPVSKLPYPTESDSGSALPPLQWLDADSQSLEKQWTKSSQRSFRSASSISYINTNTNLNPNTNTNTNTNPTNPSDPSNPSPNPPPISPSASSSPSSSVSASFLSSSNPAPLTQDQLQNTISLISIPRSKILVLPVAMSSPNYLLQKKWEFLTSQRDNGSQLMTSTNLGSQIGLIFPFHCDFLALKPQVPPSDISSKPILGSPLDFTNLGLQIPAHYRPYCYYMRFEDVPIPGHLVQFGSLWRNNAGGSGSVSGVADGWSGLCDYFRDSEQEFESRVIRIRALIKAKSTHFGTW